MSLLARRLLVVSTLTLLFAAVVSPAVLAMADAQLLASEEPPAEEPVDEGPSGAYIDVPVEEDEGVTQDWTYRFLIPTSLVLIAVVVAGTVVMYFVRVVRTRYTTVG